MKILYQAEDGYVFTTKEGCENYESNKIPFFTSNGEQAPYLTADFAFIRDTAQSQFFKQYVEKQGDSFGEYRSFLPGLYYCKRSLIRKKSIWTFAAGIEIIQAIKDKGLLT